MAEAVVAGQLVVTHAMVAPAVVAQVVVVQAVTDQAVVAQAVVVVRPCRWRRISFARPVPTPTSAATPALSRKR